MVADCRATEFAPAKINLALHVRGRRADGYHQLESWFAFADFGDQLHARPAADWALDVRGPMAAALAGEAGNLVLRAAAAFAAASGLPQRFAFTLEKRIPVAAGLGGGSADAAAALRLLNRLAGEPLGAAQLAQLAAALGADVPACLRSTSQLGSGTGTVLRPAPAVAGSRLLLANPGVAVATAAVFAAWDGIDRGPLAADWPAARNDLQAAAIRLQPAIADVLRWLRGMKGAQHVRMSGSGATCFALFEGDVPEITPPAGWWVRAVQLI